MGTPLKKQWERTTVLAAGAFPFYLIRESHKALAWFLWMSSQDGGAAEDAVFKVSIA